MDLRWVPWTDRSVQAEPAVLVSFDDDEVVLFQAFGEEIGEHALAHDHFGGRAWRFDRATKLRTSFLALMHRTDWGQMPGREAVLAIHITRHGFDELLRLAVHKNYPEGLYDNKRGWQLATRYGQVLIDWEQNLCPQRQEYPGGSLRLELRDAALRRFIDKHILRVEDLRERAASGPSPLVPEVATYPIPTKELSRRLLWCG